MFLKIKNVGEESKENKPEYISVQTERNCCFDEKMYNVTKCLVFNYLDYIYILLCVH